MMLWGSSPSKEGSSNNVGSGGSASARTGREMPVPKPELRIPESDPSRYDRGHESLPDNRGEGDVMGGDSEARILKALKETEERMYARMGQLEAYVTSRLIPHPSEGGGRRDGEATLPKATVAPPSATGERSKETSPSGGACNALCASTDTSAEPTRLSSSNLRRRRASISGDSETQQVWALVEGDQDIRTMLRDVRKDMDTFSTKFGRSTGQGGGGGGADGDDDTENRSLSRRMKQGGGSTKRGLGVRSAIGNAAMIEQSIVRRSCRMLCGRVMHPDSRFRSIWNVVLGLLIVYCGIAVPLEIAFEEDMVESMCGYGLEYVPRAECAGYLAWWYCNLLIDLFFIADIIVNTRTGYMVEGHFVDDDWLVLKHYLKGSFLIDFLGSFPLHLIMIAADPSHPYGRDANDIEQSSDQSVLRVNRLVRMVRLTKLAKLARMFKLAKYLEYAEMIIKFNPGMLRIIKLGLAAILCCHWFGCIWWLISDLERNIEDMNSEWYAGDNTWHPPLWLVNERQLAIKYWHSFFWGAGMVTSMVPRDIEPVTSLEAFVTIFTMFFGLMLNAFVISSTTSAIAQMDSKKELAGKQLDKIRNYLLVKMVPSDLRSRILMFYEYLLTSSQSLADSQIFDQMPPNLSAQLAISVNRRLLARCTFFRDVSNASLVQLMRELKPLVFVPDQLLFSEGHLLTSVYFLNRGLVQLSLNGEQVGSLSDADNFGLEDFTKQAATGATGEGIVVRMTGKAMTYCDVMSLSMELLAAAIAEDVTFHARMRERERDHAAVADKTRTKSKLGLGTKLGLIAKRHLAHASRSSPGQASDASSLAEEAAVNGSKPPVHRSIRRTPSATFGNLFAAAIHAASKTHRDDGFNAKKRGSRGGLSTSPPPPEEFDA